MEFIDGIYIGDIMKKRKLLIIVIVFVFVYCLSGCKSSNNSSSMHFSTLTNIFETYESDLNTEFDNLSLPSAITLDPTNELYTFTRTSPSMPSKDEVTSSLVELTKAILDWDITTSEIECNQYATGDVYEITNEDGSLYASYSCRYGITLQDYSMIDVQDKAEDVIKVIHIDRNDSITEYKEIVGNFNEKLEALLPYLCSDISYRAKELYILGDNSGNQSFEIVYEACYKDTPIDASCDYSMCRSGFSKPTSLVMKMYDNQHISDLVVLYPDEYKMPATQCEDQFITLKSATESISTYLAKYRHFQVSDIEIAYVCITAISEGKAPEGEYKPMWKFVLEENISTEQISLIPQTQMCAYVDMQTGEIYIVDNINHNVYFDLTGGEYDK